MTHCLQGSHCDFLKFILSRRRSVTGLSGLPIIPQGLEMLWPLPASVSASLFFKHGKSFLLQALGTHCSLSQECPLPASCPGYLCLIF